MQSLDVVDDFRVIKALAEGQDWTQPPKIGRELDRTAEGRKAYVNRVVKFIDVGLIKPLKIVINSGNGAAGPTFDAIAERLKDLGAPLEFVRVHHDPDPTFPNGIPNPLLVQNHSSTANAVKETNADFGVAFDGDFDRWVSYLMRLVNSYRRIYCYSFATIFLEKEAGSKIVHDPRVIWNTKDIIALKGGVAIQSKTGHTFIKQKMRAEKAIYGGEISAHHYFRDFAYCDSGMIPWVLLTELCLRQTFSGRLGKRSFHHISKFR